MTVGSLWSHRSTTACVFPSLMDTHVLLRPVRPEVEPVAAWLYDHIVRVERGSETPWGDIREMQREGWRRMAEDLLSVVDGASSPHPDGGVS